jgi:hypothetical protein
MVTLGPVETTKDKDQDKGAVSEHEYDDEDFEAEHSPGEAPSSAMQPILPVLCAAHIVADARRTHVSTCSPGLASQAEGESIALCSQ